MRRTPKKAALSVEGSISAHETQVDESARITRAYGDLVFDLCMSALNNETDAKTIWKSTLKQFTRKKEIYGNTALERVDVLAHVIRQIKEHRSKKERPLSASDQVLLDAIHDPEQRLEHISSFLLDLPLEERLILLLKDKLGVPLDEISRSLGISTDSLRLRRSRALRLLEEQIWTTPF